MTVSRHILTVFFLLLGVSEAHADSNEIVGNWNILTRPDRLTDAIRHTVLIGSAPNGPDGTLGGSKLVFRFACEEGRPQTLRIGLYNSEQDFPDDFTNAVVDARVDKRKPVRQNWRIAGKFAIQQSANLSHDFLTYLKTGANLFIRYRSTGYFVEVDFKLDQYDEILARISSKCKLGIE